MWGRRKQPLLEPQVLEPFDMPIDDVFGLKVKGSVVVVGVIAAGEIKPCMQLKIRSQDSVVPVTVIALEGGPRKPLSSARAGDRVGVLLQGVEKNQVPAGAHLVAGGS